MKKLALILLLFLASERMAVAQSPDNPINHSNAPLGLTLAQAAKAFPACGLSTESNSGYESQPLTGYVPAFTDLLPAWNGTILVANAPPGESQTLQDGTIPTLDNGNITYEDAWCGDPNDLNAPDYNFVVYNNKIMVVLRSTHDQAGTSAQDEMNSLMPGLVGQLGPMHQANDIQSGAPVLVTYADKGNVRTVLETWDRYNSNLGLSWVRIDLAYVDLSLYATYSNDVISQLKSLADQNASNTNAIKNGL